MSQRSPTYTPDVSADTIDYKPLSPLAVAGILCAGLYAALILIIAVADFFKGEPFFLPNATLWIWPIALPLGGGVLSALALWQIHNSEGTRAGAGLAKWGLGISLVAVLGYFTYTTFTELAIVQQANHFLTEKDEQAGFFPRLQGNDIDLHTAFLFTLDVADRGASLSTNAKDLERLDFPVGNNPKGRLTQFLDNPLVKLVRFASPGSSTIEPLGVRGWSYEGGAYRVVRSYRITTEEAVFDVPVAVSSIEPTTAGEKRRWKVEPVPPTAIQLVSQTALGINRHELRHKSAEFVGDRAIGWLAVLRNRDDMEAYLRTQPFTQRKQLRQSVEAIRAGTPLVALTGVAMAPWSSKVDGELMTQLVPGYHPLDKAYDYFKMDNLRIWDPSEIARVKSAIKQALSTKALPNLYFKVPPDDFAPLEVKDGEVLITHQAEIRITVVFPKSDKGEVLSGEVLLLVKIVAAAPENLDPLATNAFQQWYVKSAQIVRGLPVPQT